MKKTIISPLLFLLHASVMFGAYFLLHHFGILKNQPNSYNLANWDASILLTIRDQGYFFDMVHKHWNTGMFPLFPYVWRLTGLGSPGICIFNYLLMLGSFWWLSTVFKIKPILQLWLLSVPTMLFFFLPYSEAFFFLSSTAILVGVHKEKRWLTAAGIYFAMLSRGSGLFFIPLFIIIEWIDAGGFTFQSLFTAVRKSLLPVSAVLLGIATIASMQYYQTGYAFSFFYVQTVGAGKHFHLVHFPLTTWYQLKNLWHDGGAALVGMIASIILLFTLWGKSEKMEVGKTIWWNSKVARVSLLYLVIQFWYLAFNAPSDPTTGCTSIMALGRYIFCTPFWMIFALALVNRPKLPTSTFIFSIIVSFFLICPLGVHAFFHWSPFWDQFSDPAFVYHVCLLLLTLPLFFANRLKVSNYFLVAGYLVFIFMQLVLFDAFIGNIWVG